MLAGIVKVLRTNAEQATLGLFLASIITSGFVGIIMYCLIKDNIDNFYIQFAIVGISGCFSDRAFIIFEKFLKDSEDDGKGTSE